MVDYTTPGNNDPILGKLSSLIQWHFDDPVDDFEINRNEVIFGFQQNRNPFIDHPNLVNFLCGENIGQSWNENLSVNNFNLDEDLIIFPNPSNGVLNFTNTIQNGKIEIISLTGQKILEKNVANINSFRLNIDSGVYLLKISNNKRVNNFKIIIR